MGTSYDVQTLDGNIKLKIPQGVTFGEILRVKERGVPIDKYRRGDLLIRVVIKIPAKLSKKALEMVEKLKEEGL